MITYKMNFFIELNIAIQLVGLLILCQSNCPLLKPYSVFIVGKTNAFYIHLSSMYTFRLTQFRSYPNWGSRLLFVFSEKPIVFRKVFISLAQQTKKISFMDFLESTEKRGKREKRKETHSVM